MNKIFSILLLALSFNVFGQDDKTVTLIVSGQGKTKDEAKQVALKSAIGQVFGVFISSKIEILNDDSLKDEIAYVTNGNIQSFAILNESQLPNSRWSVMLKAVVSLNKLISFVEAKGIAIEFKGSLFAANIKQQILNEQGEIISVYAMVELLHEPMQISFDYLFEYLEPKSLDEESKIWAIPLHVEAVLNKNLDFCANYYIKTLSALSLSSEEVKSYQSLNKDIFTVVITYLGVDKTFYLREVKSILALITFAREWSFYGRLFTIESGMGMETLFGNEIANGKGECYFEENYTKERGDALRINFDLGQQTFKWDDKRTLAQIEEMTDYNLKPRGVISQFKHGGLVVYEENGHGLVTAFSNLGYGDWNTAMTICDELVLNGYSDWYLPSKEELEAIYHNLKKTCGHNIFNKDNYWSSTEWGNNIKKIGNLYTGNTDTEYNNHDHDYYHETYGIRAVRKF